MWERMHNRSVDVSRIEEIIIKAGETQVKKSLKRDKSVVIWRVDDNKGIFFRSNKAH